MAEPGRLQASSIPGKTLGSSSEPTAGAPSLLTLQESCENLLEPRDEAPSSTTRKDSTSNSSELRKGAPSLPKPTPSQPTQGGTKKPPLSWQKFTQSGHQHLDYHRPNVENGAIVIRPPPAVAEVGRKMWENGLIGKFLGKTPAHGRVVAMVNGLWGKRSKVTVSIKDKMYIFHFLDKASMDWVLESGPWHVDKSYLVLRKWSVELAPEQLSMKKLPIWVRLRNIPLAFYHREGISYIASGVGRPLYMDRATANGTRLDFAKVCIEIDAMTDIPEKLRLEIEDNCATEIEVEVPWLPEKCTKCEAFGHICKQKQRTAVHEISSEIKLKKVESGNSSQPPTLSVQEEGEEIVPACLNLADLEQGRERNNFSDTDNESMDSDQSDTSQMQETGGKKSGNTSDSPGEKSLETQEVSAKITQNSRRRSKRTRRKTRKGGSSPSPSK